MTDTEPAPGAETASGGDFERLKASLPEELRDSPALRSYGSLESLARSHIEAQRMIGKRIEDATPDELGRFYARHGRPKTPGGYELPPGGDEPAPGRSPEFEAAARQWFFDAGLSQRQAEILAEKWKGFALENSADAERTAAESREAAETELRRDWGRTYERRIAAATRAVGEFGGGDLADYLDETGLGNDPRLIRAFARIAEMVGEDSLIGDGEGEFALRPAAARQEITKAMANPAYFDANHPEHDASVEKMRNLFAAAYPDLPR